MSLSEWDVLALDERGRPSNGTSEPSPAGVTVSPVEGVLQLESAECWHPLSPLPNPQFVVLRAGEATVLDIWTVAETVHFPPAKGQAVGAVRGICWATWFHRGAEIAATVGITVRGFDADQKYVGVTAADVSQFRAIVKRWAQYGRVPPQLAELGTANALRFNQGDARIAKQVGTPYSATPPGEAELPLLYHAKRREAVEPHIVRRDLAPPPAPDPVPASVKRGTKSGRRTANEPTPKPAQKATKRKRVA